VIQRDPICVLCHTAFSTVADHHPKTRKQLLEEGLNPNDPHCGRGLCKPCHDSETARNQPGGWNQ
jgi:5-methylcytosine-specific restriction protein A